jgi:quercetin dioxygenase-like cupin family protein
MSKSFDQELSNTAQDDAVFAELAKALKPIPPPLASAAHLRSKIMDRVAQEKREVSDQFVTMKADKGWFEMAPKIEKKVLYVDREAGTESYLLRVQPGAIGPAHKHTRDELCMVLEGEFYLGDIHLKAGDFHMASAGSTHGEAYSENGALVFLQGALEDQNV